MYHALLRLRPFTAALPACLLVLALPVTAPAQIHAAAARGDLTEVALRVVKHIGKDSGPGEGHGWAPAITVPSPRVRVSEVMITTS